MCIFPKCNLTLLRNTFVFQNQAKFSCMYICNYANYILQTFLRFVRGNIVIWGAYHTKNFDIFETGTNGTEISWEKFQKIRKLLNFQKANYSNKNSGNSGMKIKWNRNFQEKFFKNLDIPHEVVLFFRIYANSQFSTQC